MENRSNNVLVGGVVLALTVIVVVFLIWIAGFSGGSDKMYDIFFKTSVDGLAKGSTVTFSGVPVGKVEDINIMPESPEFVQVRVKVKDSVPVLQGTTATIAGVGFTGVSQINLDGAVKGAPPLTDAGPYGVPVIPTKPGALGELLNSAPQLLDKLSTLTDRLGLLLDDRNRNSISNILANIDKLSGSLANRGPEIAATLAETRVAIRQAGAAAEQIGSLAATTNGVMNRDVQPAMANLNKAIASAQHTMETLDTTINEARPGIKTLTTKTVPNANELIRNLNEMAEALTAVSDKLNRGGAASVLGGGKLPDYKPGRQ